MAILVHQDTEVLIQGITGIQGTWTAKMMLGAGTRLVAGVTPGKGGQTAEGVPVYDSVREAVRVHPGLSATLSLVPARLTKDAVLEAVDAGLKLVVIGAEGVPIFDAMEAITHARSCGVQVIGPDALGVFSPGKGKIGSHADRFFRPGPVGIVGKGGTSSYEIAGQICAQGLGVSTVVNMGGARVNGTSFEEILELFEQDPETRAIAMIGEIGGSAEEQAAEFIKDRITKLVVAIILGRSAPPGKQMGHAGAIIERGMGDYHSKEQALTAARVTVARSPEELAAKVRALL